MGILNPLYEAVAWVFKGIWTGLSSVFGASSGWTWALTIVFLVVLMRLIMVPLFIKQMHTTRAMTALAPQMTALRKKYKNDKQALNQEMMKLYQEAGVNPLMGCLPVVAQLPMFFALFSVLRAISEWKPGQPPKYGMTEEMMVSAQHAKILGVTISDKFLFSHGVPLEAKAVILITVLVSMTTTYLTVRQSMKRGMMPAATPDNPMGQSQKYMAYIMPLFALSGLYWPFGLVLYWVTTNLWTLGQQYVLFRKYPQPKLAGGTLATAGAPALQPGTPGKPALSQNGSGSSSGTRREKALPGPGKPGSDGGKPGPAGGKPGGGPGAARPAGSGSGTSASAPPAANGGGMLRRLGKGRPEPPPEPEAPEVKLVRQQPQRQSRSKRSGKR
ncbi:MAG: membrane protein insertase YidC [Streptosporangiaceae bacterium]